jgi:hypothetical protein
MIRSLFAFLACLWMQPALAQDGAFKSPSVGFEVVKPAAWHFFTAQQAVENIKRTEMNDKELQAIMAKYASAPLVGFTKYQEPYDDVNPSFRVNIRPLGALAGRDPKEIIAVVLPTFQKAFSDFAVVQAPADVTVSGLRGAYARFNYTLRTPNASFPTASELWIVPRGDHFFMIGAGTRQDEKTGSRREIQEILASVKIDP